MSAYEISAFLHRPNRYLVTERSRNAKTGPIMVTTTDSSSCPDACPFKSGACYAKAGPLALNWRKLDNGASPTIKGLKDVCEAIERQPQGALWRMNQAGDLPGKGDAIDRDSLDQIVQANHGKRGFTYTHKPMNEANAAAVKSANEQGFTINLSGNHLAHADELADLNIAPVVTVLPSDATRNVQTPAGRTVVICPATQRDDVSCATCGLCQRQRKTIVGFPAHGASKRKADAISKS